MLIQVHFYYVLINLDCSFFFIFFLSLDFQSNNNKKSLLNDYDTGIGSTTTLLSSPQPSRSQVKTNGHFTTYMQVIVIGKDTFSHNLTLILVFELSWPFICYFVRIYALARLNIMYYMVVNYFFCILIKL